MKTKLFVVLAVVAFIPAVSFAQNNIGSCGWGSKVFDGQKGVIPQVLAVTTNGTSGNQTFAISSGTSGCTQDGVVTSSWKTAMFMDNNKTKIVRDMSVGHGEALTSLASVMGIADADQAVFFSATKSHFAEIFPSHQVSTVEALANLKAVMKQYPELAGYSDVI